MITKIAIEYDRRGLGKLRGRDRTGYIKHCYNETRPRTVYEWIASGVSARAAVHLAVR